MPYPHDNKSRDEKRSAAPSRKQSSQVHGVKTRCERAEAELFPLYAIHFVCIAVGESPQIGSSAKQKLYTQECVDAYL